MIPAQVVVEQSLTAKEQPLSKIFCDDYLFQIPSYQRPYSWAREEAGELLDDLLASSRRNDDTPYFLGSIVLIKRPDEPAAEVVDGQQRLTTLTVLIAALRELSNSNDAEQLSTFIVEKANRFTGAVDRFRLTPRERDTAFFREYIQTRGNLVRLIERADELPDAQSNYRQVARLYRGRLIGLTDEERVALAAHIAQRCYLVAVAVTSRESAYRIFAVMNNRGLDLSPTDILKSDIIGAIPERMRERHTEAWEDIEEELGRKPFEDLFGHIRMIYRKAKAERSLVEEFTQYVRPQAEPQNFIDEVLSPRAEAFETIRTASYQSGDGRAAEINLSLRALALIDNTDWVPVATEFFKLHAGESQELLAFIRDLERLAYSLFIRRVYVTPRVAQYGRVIAAIQAGANLRADDSPMQLSEAERNNTLAALNGHIYSEVKTRLPILLRLDSALSDPPHIHDPTASTITVEHVLPQTPADGSQWLKDFANPEERQQMTNLLGNLALLSRRKNSQAQNFDFDRKKREYFAHGGVTTFALTTQVLNTATWSPEVVRQRQNELIGQLAGVWRL